ncbi:VCBS repeat-containing protein [Streptomyces sp. Ru87]|uniref:FG-GAP repeat domain-containing protein n=1 Tax=Streptomyces sp. Ru87 TaxID=2044307 RepID=UPI000BF24F13|nr:VCBS repeat-containing protein [Streptomyces sp. Ru87]PGH46857.1 hypothetical protein CRI70_31690 [Streptomyces sp. Ru87]
MSRSGRPGRAADRKRAVRRGLTTLAAGLLVATGTATGTAPAYAAEDPTVPPAKEHRANAEILDAECVVPPTHDPAVNVIVHRVARAHDANAKVMLAAFEAGWVESHMNNLNCGDKDSIGVFQQRPSYGWGTVEQIMDPVYAATQFVVRAIESDRRDPGQTAGQLAQSVQGSAHPGRYDVAEPTARALMAEAARMAGIFGGSPTDFNGDGKDDIITFTQNAEADVYVATAGDRAFGGTRIWQQRFGVGGETPLTGDFNKDGIDDVVTFTHGSEAKVYVALSNSQEFGPASVWHDFFAPRHETPAVGDVNGDGYDDIITFTHDEAADVHVALNTGDGRFGAAEVWHDFFGRTGEFPALGDVDGDGMDDLITFTQGAEGDVYVALSNGDGFGASQVWHEHFAVGNEQPRVGDVDGDGFDDIVTFTQGDQGDVYVARSTGGGFGASELWHEWFSPAGEFPYLGDYDGDGQADIVSFTRGDKNDVHVALSNGTDGFVEGAVWHDFFGLTGETSL